MNTLSDWLWQMNAPRSAAHVDDDFLADLVGRFVHVADFLRDVFDALHGAVGGHDGFAHFFVPHAEAHEVAHEVFVHHDVLAGEGAAGVEVGGVRLEALVVAQIWLVLAVGMGATSRELRTPVFFTRSRRHPSPSVWKACTPHMVELEHALAHRRTLEGFVRAVFFRQGALRSWQRSRSSQKCPCSTAWPRRCRTAYPSG
jgi:hypothetical protein